MRTESCLSSFSEMPIQAPFKLLDLVVLDSISRFLDGTADWFQDLANFSRAGQPRYRAGHKSEADMPGARSTNSIARMPFLDGGRWQRAVSCDRPQR